MPTQIRNSLGLRTGVHTIRATRAIPYPNSKYFFQPIWNSTLTLQSSCSLFCSSPWLCFSEHDHCLSVPLTWLGSCPFAEPQLPHETLSLTLAHSVPHLYSIHAYFIHSRLQKSKFSVDDQALSVSLSHVLKHLYPNTVHSSRSLK